ncbi:MAG: hypothetical protein ERJ67_04235 [Aphanocapsa feldmannii 277cV]|uniref:Uncharacterized protein n=2 Tax=Aphanocapsa feldmannii TaxID=192050 RepID=A0A524RP74_9CHRO|nr:MAG: hypothetical protein ERJ67_04235 [Aphanocapsa feldmannii 277cV]TGH21554.1 MAG: hypothetical protein ERJ68_05340 [Aphanocapsa feldmannii 277cI]
MAVRASCRTCRHCCLPAEAVSGWCWLRELPLHREWLAEIHCPHWMIQSPELPLGSEIQDRRCGADVEQLHLSTPLFRLPTPDG